MSRAERITALIESAFAPCEVSVRDDSHLHVGHEGARDGRGHFTVTVISPSFEGLRPIERHRAIHQALEGMMSTDIHALSIHAKTPKETR